MSSGFFGGIGRGIADAGERMGQDALEANRQKRLEEARIRQQQRAAREHDRQYKQQRTNTLSDRETERKWSLEDEQRNRQSGIADYRTKRKIDADYREPPKPETFTAEDGRLMMLDRDGTAKPVTEDTTRPFEDYPRFDENDRVPGLLSGQRDQPVRAAPKASDAIKPTAMIQDAEYLVKYAGFANPREAVEYLKRSKFNPQEHIVELTASMVQKQSESFVQPGDEGYRTPEQFAEDAKAIVRASIESDAPASSPPGQQAAQGYPDGTRLHGPDGKIYVVRDGKPVLAE